MCSIEGSSFFCSEAAKNAPRLPQEFSPERGPSFAGKAAKNAPRLPQEFSQIALSFVPHFPFPLSLTPATLLNRSVIVGSHPNWVQETPRAARPLSSSVSIEANLWFKIEDMVTTVLAAARRRRASSTPRRNASFVSKATTVSCACSHFDPSTPTAVT